MHVEKSVVHNSDGCCDVKFEEKCHDLSVQYALQSKKVKIMLVMAGKELDILFVFGTCMKDFLILPHGQQMKQKLGIMK